jgi:hypothetical protein
VSTDEEIRTLLHVLERTVRTVTPMAGGEPVAYQIEAGLYRDLVAALQGKVPEPAGPAVWEYKVVDGSVESDEPYFTEPKLAYAEYCHVAQARNGTGATLKLLKRAKGTSEWTEVKTMMELFPAEESSV